MTLSVAVSWVDDAGVERDLPLASNLAGFESTRTTFYGCSAARERGLRLFPLLGDGYELRVAGAELDTLAAELAQLEALAQEIGDYASYWKFRLDNIRAAIAAARARGRGAYVSIG